VAHDHHHHDHVHGPDCDHGHTHGAGESHTHAPTGEYYLEQLLTLFVCGAFGTVAVLMNLPSNRMLDVILAPEFHGWVTAGGIALLAFTLIRGIVLWRTAGQPIDCGHAHAPGEDHTHGNIFWRLVVLAFPLLLFGLGLPNRGFSQDWVNRRLGNESAVAVGDVIAKDGETAFFEFHDLNAMAYDPDKRTAWEGRSVKVKGQMRKLADKQYTLYRLKMNCCAADTIPLKARIVTEFVSTFADGKWVTAEGTLQFVEEKGKGTFLPVIRVKEAAKLALAPAEL
jgi:uncharacterized repeat protein (TIGR03943 family)